MTQTPPRVKGGTQKRRASTRQSEIADLSHFALATESLEAAALACMLIRDQAAPTSGNVNPVVPFGKHKGATIKNCPAAYLRWLLTLRDLSDDLRGPIAALLGHYDAQRSPKRKGGAK